MLGPMVCEMARRAAEVGKPGACKEGWYSTGLEPIHGVSSLPRRWETLQDKSRSPGAFPPFPKVVVSIIPKTGYGTNRSEFGMGPGEGDWRLVMLGDSAAGRGDETTGGGFLQLVGKQAGIWGLPNHLKHLQSCLDLKEFLCTCCHPRAWWETQHRASRCTPCMGGQSQNPCWPRGREAAAAPGAAVVM